MIPTRLLHRLAACAPLAHYGQLPFYWGVTRQLERVLDPRPGERVLDIGCGTGIGAVLARGPYVGIDVDVPCVRFAHAHWPTCAFAVMSALDLGFCDAAFDKATLINVAHHLPDVVLDRLFEQLTRIVRTRVVVLDVDRGFANAVGRFLIDRDRGAHVRERAALRDVLTRHYDVESELAFHNLTRTVPQVLFSLLPKPAPAAAN